jgi:hypothetical protein
MAVSFTTPNRKNVVTTLVTDPLSLNISGVEDALSLTTLLPTATIAFQADGQNFTHGLNVTAWTNNGTGGTTYDASTGGVTANEPVYDGLAADNPFKAPLGALYFADSSLSAWDYLNLANKFSTSGAFVMYAVFGYETGFDGNTPPTLISVKSASADSSAKSIHILSKHKKLVSIFDENHLLGGLPEWRIGTTEDENTAAATPYVLVIRRDASGNIGGDLDGGEAATLFSRDYPRAARFLAGCCFSYFRSGCRGDPSDTCPALKKLPFYRFAYIASAWQLCHSHRSDGLGTRLAAVWH